MFCASAEFAAIILFGITGTIKSAYRILCGITMVYGIANAYVVQFRTNPIVPWDILSIKTAASVADNYDFTPTVRMVAATIALTALIVLLHFAKVSVCRIAFWKRAAAAAAVVFVLAGFSGIYTGLHDECGWSSGNLCDESGVYVH